MDDVKVGHVWQDYRFVCEQNNQYCTRTQRLLSRSHQVCQIALPVSILPQALFLLELRQTANASISGSLQHLRRHCRMQAFC